MCFRTCSHVSHRFSFHKTINSSVCLFSLPIVYLVLLSTGRSVRFNLSYNLLPIFHPISPLFCYQSTGRTVRLNASFYLPAFSIPFLLNPLPIFISSHFSHLLLSTERTVWLILPPYFPSYFSPLLKFFELFFSFSLSRALSCKQDGPSGLLVHNMLLMKLDGPSC